MSVARPTEAFAESSNSRNPRALAGQPSMTLDSIVSTLFNLFSAFFAFIAAPENSLSYHCEPELAYICESQILSDPALNLTAKQRKGKMAYLL
jgi:hypothetical protein